MDVELVRWTLDDRALAYVLNALEDGTILGAALQSLISDTHGELFTLTPPDVSEAQIYEFSWGGLFPPRSDGIPTEGGGRLFRVDSVIGARDEMFAAFLKTDPRACCVVCEQNARPNAPHPVTEPTAFWVGERCYHWLGPDSSVELVQETLRLAEMPWYGGAACCLPVVGLQKTDVNDEILIDLANHAVQISVGAYDGEGFVIWQRGSARLGGLTAIPGTR